jgi:protein SCO1/2
MKWLLAIVAAAACTTRPSDHAAVVPPPIPTGPSIYDLDITLEADGPIELDVDRGRRTLVSMFYGSCAAACPALIDEIARVMRDAPSDTRVLLVSFDAARDTPARLRELARAHHLDDRWTLAAAAEPDARELAAVLNIRYRALANGDFNHTSAVVLVDADGRPLARMDGLGNHSALVAALSR